MMNTVSLNSASLNTGRLNSHRLNSLGDGRGNEVVELMDLADSTGVLLLDSDGVQLKVRR